MAIHICSKNENKEELIPIYTRTELTLLTKN